MSKMDQKLKAKWIAALRSGAYKQGGAQLCRVTKDGAAYCCLGVLAEVVEGHDSWQGTQNLYMGSNMSPFVYSVPGIEGDVGLLTNMNDNGKSFNEIADWIETNL